jgi:membrane protein
MLDRLRHHEVTLAAAGLAFFALLALLPALAALLAVYGMVADPDDVARQISSWTDTLPDATSAFLQEQLEELASSSQRGLQVGAFIAVALSLWTVSLATRALIRAVNVAFDCEEERSYVALRLTALWLAGALVVATAVLLAAIVVVPEVVPEAGFRSVIGGVGRWPALFVFTTLVLSFVYWVSPTVRRPQHRFVSAGGLVAASAIMIGTLGFDRYINHFAGRFTETYGALAGLIVLMLWFYLCAFAVVIGAEVDAEVEVIESVEADAG